MPTELGWLYLGGGTLLFVFWAYGLYAFVRDVKRVGIPKAKQFIRGRRRLKREKEREQERAEREKELY